MNTPTLFAALDLHSSTTVLGTLTPDGVHSRPVRFRTTPEHLVERVAALGRKGVILTLESSPLARWVAKLLRPHVERLVVCEPRYNKLIGSDPNKRDEFDVRSLCLLLSLGHLKEVWIEDPSRFNDRSKLWRYCALSITDRTSDGKPLGYQRIDRRGNNELKNLSYHAWRTACKSTTGDNAVKAFYHGSLERTGTVRHARLNTQRKILEALWRIWLNQQDFDPHRFFQTPTSDRKPRTAGATNLR